MNKYLEEVIKKIIMGSIQKILSKKRCQLGGLYPPEYPVHELSFARVSMTEDKNQSNCLFNNLFKIESIFLDIWINYSLS